MSVNMYWRRFAMSSIPLSDHEAFEDWLIERWREKDELLDQWYTTSRFPSDIGSADSKKGISEDGFIETEMTLGNWMEIGQLYVVLATVALIVNIILQLLTLISSMR